jgi:hypothetical protein
MLMTCYYNVGIDAEIGASKHCSLFTVLRFRAESDEVSMLQQDPLRDPWSAKGCQLEPC